MMIGMMILLVMHKKAINFAYIAIAICMLPLDVIRHPIPYIID